MSTRNRGQIFSSDLVLSFAVFSVILSVAVVALNIAWSNQTQFSRSWRLERKSLIISDLLVRSNGYPDDWNASNIRIVGIAQPSHIIQPYYLSKLANLSEKSLRSAWQLQYDISFYLNLSASNYSWQRGQRWNESADEIVPQTRSVLINDSGRLKRGVLELTLWG